MKFLLVLAVVVAVASAQNFGRARPLARASQPLRPAASSQVFKRVPAPRAASNDQNANIVRFDSEINPDGGYKYSYETDNGIAASEQGSAGLAQGYFGYTSPEGQPISVSYVADENGFQPQSDVLPVGPPIPEAIARALKWIASQPPQKKKK